MAGRREDEPRNEAVASGAEAVTQPELVHLTERRGDGIELGRIIDSLLEVTPEHASKIAQAAVNVRSKLIDRRLYGENDSRLKFSTAIISACNELGITAEDYERARLLVTVPANELPIEMQGDRQRIRETIIDKVDVLVRQDIATFNRFFPDAATHKADLYQISYEYAEAQDRISQKRDEGKDSLTGLINDQGYLSDIFEIELQLLTLLEENRALLVVRVDLDNFKKVNDTLGHDEGDRVLREFAANLNATFHRTFDVVGMTEGEKGVSGRPGGDEFVLIINDVNMQSWVNISEVDSAHYPLDYLQQHGIGNKVLFAIARKIRECAAKIVVSDGTSLGASVGLARIHQEEASQMLYGNDARYTKIGFKEYNRRADAAAIWAKEWGDGVAAEWGPDLRSVPMTFERLKAKAMKRFGRDYPELTIDPEIATQLDALARILANKYAELPKK